MAGSVATRPDPAAWPGEHGHGLWMIDQVAVQVTPDRDPGGTTGTGTFTISAPS